MAKADDRASQYVFVEDEDIFEEDEKRLANLVKIPSKKIETVPTKALPVKVHYDSNKIKLQQDAAKLHRARKLLSENAIPPPPSVTNPQFALAHILNMLHNNNFFDKLKSNKWKHGLSEEQLGHDVYPNSNQYIEELEHIRLNIQDRFVSNETSCHFFTLTSHAPSLADKEMRKRNGWLQSPASRVSYISQRNIVFNNFPNNVRTITVDNTKRFTFLKNNSKCKTTSTSKAHVPKRALFQSPEKQTSGIVPPSNYSSGSSAYSNMPPSDYSIPSAASTASSSSSNSLITPSRSMLSKWVASRVEMKQTTSTPRSRDSSVRKSCSKSLKFDEHVTPSSDKKDKSVKKPKKLSQHHCKKMLWAVETLLKNEGITPSTDPEHKALYSSIYRETSQVWLQNYENKPRVSGLTSGTSDLMVSVAKTLLPSIEQKLGISCRAIKARKELDKANLDISAHSLNNSNLLLRPHDYSSINLSLNGSTAPAQDTCEVDCSREETVFSPEVVGGTNLYDDINAVISSLDNLQSEVGSVVTNEPMLLPSSLLHSRQNDINLQTVERSLIENKPIQNISTSNVIVENFIVDSKEQMKSESLEQDPNAPANNSMNIPNCIVKLERCDYVVENSEPVQTLQQSSVTKLRKSCTNDQSELSSLEINGNISDQIDGKEEPLLDTKQEKSIISKSDTRKSKRKRSSDISSSETTPVSLSSKRRSSKRLCSNQESESLESQEKSTSLRRSSRNQLSSEIDGVSPLVEVKNQNIVKTLSFEEEHQNICGPEINIEEASSSRAEISVSKIETSKPNLDEHDTPQLPHSGINKVDESSTSLNQEGETSQNAVTKVVSENALDKENDSSMENISDVDTQNWSPILKLKRSSKNLWSSELKKKRISNRRRKENVENSPLSSPFLDLEGPFKYRLCKRALPGDFISAIIKGEVYSKSIKKLIKNEMITKDCILVRTVKEGLELRIPFELLKKENTMVYPNKLHCMVSDVIEDVVCKLEAVSLDSAFSGFTIHDVNQATLTSWNMDQFIKVMETAGEMVKPLFAVYKYAIVKQTPHNVQNFYQIFVEILKTSLFLMKSNVEMDTIQVRPMKSESPKKIQLEINIPIDLISNYKLKENILKDLNPVHNIISY